MTMKATVVLLLACLPLVLGRLSDPTDTRDEADVNSVSESGSNETFYAKSEVCIANPCLLYCLTALRPTPNSSLSNTTPSSTHITITL